MQDVVEGAHAGELVEQHGEVGGDVVAEQPDHVPVPEPRSDSHLLPQDPGGAGGRRPDEPLGGARRHRQNKSGNLVSEIMQNKKIIYSVKMCVIQKLMVLLL